MYDVFFIEKCFNNFQKNNDEMFIYLFLLIHFVLLQSIYYKNNVIGARLTNEKKK